MSKEAMKLAIQKMLSAMGAHPNAKPVLIAEGIEALEEALAKQEQLAVSEQLGEPVASNTPLTDALNFFTDAERLEIWKKHNVSDSQIAGITQKVLSKFYATPLAKQEQGKSVAKPTAEAAHGVKGRA